MSDVSYAEQDNKPMCFLRQFVKPKFSIHEMGSKTPTILLHFTELAQWLRFSPLHELYLKVETCDSWPNLKS